MDTDYSVTDEQSYSTIVAIQGKDLLNCLHDWLQVDSMPGLNEVPPMRDLFQLGNAQMRRIELYFPRFYGVPRVDDRWVLSGIIFLIRNGLRWRDAFATQDPHKTIYNRFVHRQCLSVFSKMFAALTAASDADDLLIIAATHLKASRIAASLS